MSTRTAALAALAALAACDGDDNTIADAAASADADNTARCLIPGAYGALGSLTGTSGTMGGTTVTVTLDAGPPRDTFFLKMVSGKGAFSAGIAPGSYTISGADAQYLNCGLCVHIIADIVSGSGPSKFYFADSGSVTLTSTTPPLAGMAENLTFREVDINSGQFVTGGCTASISSISFTTN